MRKQTKPLLLALAMYFIVLIVSAQDSYQGELMLKKQMSADKPALLQKEIFQGSDNLIFRSLLEIGFAGAKLREDYMILSLLSVNGVEFQNGVFAGIGSGVEFFDLHVVPVYLDLRYAFLKGVKMSPFIYADYGYALPFGKRENENDIEGGQLFSSGLGVKGKSLKGREYSFSVGYRYQYLKSNFEDQWQGEIERKMTYKRIFVKFAWFIN